MEDKINSPAQGIKGEDNVKKKGFKSIELPTQYIKTIIIWLKIHE